MPPSTGDIANVDTVAGGRFSVYFDFKIRRPGDALGIEVSDTRNRAQSPFDFSFLLLDGREIVSEDLHSHLGADASRKHVDTVADRLGPDVGHARHLVASVVGKIGRAESAIDPAPAAMKRGSTFSSIAIGKPATT